MDVIYINVMGGSVKEMDENRNPGKYTGNIWKCSMLNVCNVNGWICGRNAWTLGLP